MSTCFTKGKIYKIKNPNNINDYYNFIDDEGDSNGFTEKQGNNTSNFKPSTEEAYCEQQNNKIIDNMNLEDEIKERERMLSMNKIEKTNNFALGTSYYKAPVIYTHAAGYYKESFKSWMGDYFSDSSNKMKRRTPTISDKYKKLVVLRKKNK
jgi:hypothetical protein